MEKLDRYEIILAGLGGQGLLLSGLILSVAASIFDGNNASQTQNYAPLARGAPSRSEIVISSKEIDYPEVIKADLFLALSQDSYDEFKTKVKEDGVIIIDPDNVYHDKKSKIKIIAAPLTKLAVETTGKEIVTSVLALGLISKLTGIVTADGIREAIRKRAPKGTEEMNVKAFNAGYDYNLN